MPYFPPQQTALDILNKIKTVDGSGSGLDADTVDGLHANELSTVATLNDLTDVTISTPSTNQVLLYNGSIWVNGTITSGVTVHSALTGLSSDDHSQYLLATGSRTGASSSRQVFTSGITTGSIRPSSDSTAALQLQDAAGTAVVTINTTDRILRIPNIMHIGDAGSIPSSAKHFVYAAAAESVAAYSTGSSAHYAALYMNSDLVNNAQMYAVAYGSLAPYTHFGRSVAKHMALLANGSQLLGMLLGTVSNAPIIVGTNNTERIRVSGGGLVSIGTSADGTALLDLSASTTTRASLRIRSGTAPTSPNDGDIWYDGTHLYCRIAGVTKQLDN